MAKAGASIVVNYQKNAEAAATVVREIGAAGGKAVAVQGDVGSLAGIGQFFQAADEALNRLCGSPHFDILVNNAGIGCGGTVATTSEETFDEVVAVNLKGPFFVTQQALARLRDCGRIINLSSALSKFAYPNMTVYSMLKAALNHFTLILAADLGTRGITANCIAPGLTVTDFTTHARQDPNIVKMCGGAHRPGQARRSRRHRRRGHPPGLRRRPLGHRAIHRSQRRGRAGLALFSLWGRAGGRRINTCQ
jgi:3-oxoacyl-[acyl-carrier protein] reductase